MGTTIRPEVSKKNKYYISKHRYYELKHFCLQYYTWKKAYAYLTSEKIPISVSMSEIKSSKIGNPTAQLAEAKAHYSYLMHMIEAAAKETDPIIGKFIFLGVTEGVSYDIINARTRIPCCKDTYYSLYRKFFSILNIKRG